MYPMDTLNFKERTAASFLVFSREELLAFSTNEHRLRHNITAELRRRYRGCMLKAKGLACGQPEVHPIIMGNVNLLPNKMD